MRPGGLEPGITVATAKKEENLQRGGFDVDLEASGDRLRFAPLSPTPPGMLSVFVVLATGQHAGVVASKTTMSTLPRQGFGIKRCSAAFMIQQAVTAGQKASGCVSLQAQR